MRVKDTLRTAKKLYYPMKVFGFAALQVGGTLLPDKPAEDGAIGFVPVYQDEAEVKRLFPDSEVGCFAINGG